MGGRALHRLPSQGAIVDMGFESLPLYRHHVSSFLKERPFGCRAISPSGVLLWQREEAERLDSRLFYCAGFVC
jgi:hypothetical protein